MRFRKRVKVFPGFYLNFSNSGISSSVGVRGASITFGKKGAYLNTGIPGTGLYHRQSIFSGQSNAPNQAPPPSQEFIANENEMLNNDMPGSIKSVDREGLTSSNLLELKQTLQEAFKDKIEIGEEIAKTKKDLKTIRILNIIASILVIGLFIKYFKGKIREKQEYLDDLSTQLANCKVDIDVTFDQEFNTKYIQLTESFEELTKSQMIWDVTSRVRNDTVSTRTAASASVTRRKVNFEFHNIEIIKSSFPSFHLENANGDDLFIYPGFAIVAKNKKDFGLIDLKELDITLTTTEFLEEEKIPNGTEIVGETWAKVNKNGQPDKRFKDNYRIPIVKYGLVELKTKTGLHEAYCISNYSRTEKFTENFNNYQGIIK